MIRKDKYSKLYKALHFVREVLDTAYVIKFVGELFTRCILMYGIMD